MIPSEILEFTVSRNLAEIGGVADQLRARVAEVLDEEGAAAVELSVVEALTNAVRHGSAGSAEQIGVFVEISDDQVVVEIADSFPPMPDLLARAGADALEFDAFDLENIPEAGRGMSLIVMSMDEVAFRQAGDKVRLRMVRFVQPPPTRT